MACVADIEPNSRNLNLLLKVVDVKMSGRMGASRVSEVVVGDESGTILFTAVDDQVDLMMPGEAVRLINATVEMLGGSFMRLVVPLEGERCRIRKELETRSFDVNLTVPNRSHIEWA